jgi:hypothetical protein
MRQTAYFLIVTKLLPFAIQKPPLDALLALLSECGQVVSVFLKAKPALSLNFGRERDRPLQGLEAAFPEPFSDLFVFRIDSREWCELAASATLSASYIVYQSARGLWWVLCVADED